MDKDQKNLIIKTSLFTLSLSLAWWLVKTGYLQGLIDAVLPLRFAAEIMAGVFYTSFLTSPVSVGMLLVLAKENNPILTALLAGFGAALGDFLIVKFFRQSLINGLNTFSGRLRLQIINALLKKLHLDFVVPFIGAVIIASPLPDELGLVMLGVSRLKYREIAVLTYILNTAGILLIVVPINLLS